MDRWSGLTMVIAMLSIPYTQAGVHYDGSTMLLDASYSSVADLGGSYSIRLIDSVITITAVVRLEDGITRLSSCRSILGLDPKFEENETLFGNGARNFNIQVKPLPIKLGATATGAGLPCLEILISNEGASSYIDPTLYPGGSGRTLVGIGGGFADYYLQEGLESPVSFVEIKKKESDLVITYRQYIVRLPEQTLFSCVVARGGSMDLRMQRVGAYDLQPGWNYRMTSAGSASGVPQCDRLDVSQDSRWLQP